MMSPVNSEPECWNCRHFRRGDARKVCALHRVVLPTDKGPHLICSRWSHAADWTQHTVAWWHRSYLRDAGMLYRYQLYSSEPPRPLAAFRALTPAS